MYQIQSLANPQKPSELIISFSGSLAIQHIESIRAEIIPLLKDYNEFELRFVEIQEIDLSFIQFLYTLEGELKQTNRKVIKKHEFQETIIELITNTGFETILK